MNHGAQRPNQNDIMRCYNAFTRNYRNIRELTQDLVRIRDLGFNAVWINPFQPTGFKLLKRVDPLTGVTSEVQHSLYASLDPFRVEPGFSTVQYSPQGVLNLSESELDFLKSKAFGPGLKAELIVAGLHSIQVAMLELKERMNAAKKELEKNQKQCMSQAINEAMKNMAPSEKQQIGKIPHLANLLLNSEASQAKASATLDSALQDKLSRIRPTVLDSYATHMQASEERHTLENTFHESKSAFEALASQELAYQSYQQEIVDTLDAAELRAFTDTARALGLCPMFDLVLNHVAKDSPIVRQHPAWFKQKSSFADAKEFIYSEAFEPLKDSRSDESVRSQEIFDQLILPWIDRFVSVYGFDGARVDAIRKLPKEIREKAYAYMSKKIEEERPESRVFILEELLFPAGEKDRQGRPKDVNYYKDLLGNAGATHTTGSVYYLPREWHGGLACVQPYHKNEDGIKSQTVSQGVVNFTGNHDHHSAMMKVCKQVAFDHLKASPELYACYQRCLESQKELTDLRKEQITSIFTFGFLQKIMDDMTAMEPHLDQVNQLEEIGINYRDKIATNMLAGSGGYFMLGGDEVGSLAQPSVFVRLNGSPLYEGKQLALLQDPQASYYPSVKEVVITMAIERIKHDGFFNFFDSMDNEAFKSIFLSPFVYHIEHELGSQVEKTSARFMELCKQNRLIPNKKQELMRLTQHPSSLSDDSRRPIALDRFCEDASWIRELNEVLNTLPKTNPCFWAEAFKARDRNVLIVVRKNGLGFASPTDVVIVNLDPNHEAVIDDLEIGKISQWYQEHFFGNDLVSLSSKEAKACITGSDSKRPSYYFVGPIQLSLEKFASTIDVKIKPKSHLSEYLTEPPASGEYPEPELTGSLESIHFLFDQFLLTSPKKDSKNNSPSPTKNSNLEPVEPFKTRKKLDF